MISILNLLNFTSRSHGRALLPIGEPVCSGCDTLGEMSSCSSLTRTVVAKAQWEEQRRMFELQTLPSEVEGDERRPERRLDRDGVLATTAMSRRACGRGQREIESGIVRTSRLSSQESSRGRSVQPSSSARRSAERRCWWRTHSATTRCQGCKCRVAPLAWKALAVNLIQNFDCPSAPSGVSVQKCPSYAERHRRAPV